MVAEMWVDHIARTVGQPPEAIRGLNFYREGDTTHFGQVLEGCQARRRPSSCLITSCSPGSRSLHARPSANGCPSAERSLAAPAADGVRRAPVEPAVGPSGRPECGRGLPELV